MGDPVIIAILVGAGVVIALVVIGRIVSRVRDSTRGVRDRAVMRRRQSVIEAEQQRLTKSADRILATSSTAAIAGFRIKRQIEAVFTDGHPTPNHAVIQLKADAARKGANAVINLHTLRAASGKCAAQGDAVIVQPEDAEPPRLDPEAPERKSGSE